MQSTSLPDRTTTPFAIIGLRDPIPETGSVGAKCAKDLGYPPITMQAPPIGEGPDGPQTNQILYELDGFKQWQEAGGYSVYNAAFSAAIGGYPKGAMVARADLSGYWISTAENNTTNPDTGGAGWKGWIAPEYTTTSGSAGAFTLTPDAAIPAYVANETEIWVKFHLAGTGTDTIAVSGLSAVGIKQFDATGIKVAPVIAANFYTRLLYDGTHFIILDPLPPAVAANFADKVAYLSDTKAQGTDGGAAADGSTTTRTINTVGHNGITGLSILSNQITIPAGTFKIRISCPARADQHRCWLQNMTTSAVAILGQSADGGANVGVVVQTNAHAEGVITLGSANVFEVQHYVTNGSGTNTCLGIAINNAGKSEVYTTVVIEQIA